MAFPALVPSSPELKHHLLVLPGDVGHEQVEALARSRFPRANREVDPSPVPVRSGTGRAGAPPPGALRLSRRSTLLGPFTVDRATSNELSLPTFAAVVYAVAVPAERGDPPWPGGGDRYGFGRAFPGGLPVRDELRMLEWALAAARRLGGAVRTAPSAGSPTLLVPDPAAEIDLTVWSELWLDPEPARRVMRQALPRAELDLPSAQWPGPPAGIGDRSAPGAEALTAEQRLALHTAAAEYDRAALADPAPLETYGVLADLGLDGMVALEIGGETEPPPVVAALPWAAAGAVAYRVRWVPTELEDAEAERSSLQHRVARNRATPLVAAVARAVHLAVGGEITDAMDFRVDPTEL